MKKVRMGNNRSIIISLIIILSGILVFSCNKKVEDINPKYDPSGEDSLTSAIDSLNFLSNGLFSDSTSAWELSVSNQASAFWDVMNKQAVVHITNGGHNNYHVQLMQSGVSIERGKTYSVSFYAKADANRNIAVSLMMSSSPNTSYTSNIIGITKNLAGYSYEFTMNENSDKNTQFCLALGNVESKITIDSVRIEETKLSAESKIDIKYVQASGFFDANTPFNTLDRKKSTTWSQEGQDEWIEYTFDNYSNVNKVKILFSSATDRIATFNILTSKDGGNFQNIGTFTSNGITTGLESFDISTSRIEGIRIVGNGNSLDEWNTLGEVEFWGTRNGGETPKIKINSAIKAQVDTNWTEIEDYIYVYHTPYDLPLEDRYSIDENGVEHFLIHTDDAGFEEGTSTSPRSEVRIRQQDYKTGSHQFSFDMMIPSGTSGCSVMQIFGGGDNGGATSLMLHTYNGHLYKYTSAELVMDCWDEWHSYIIQHYADPGIIRIYVDGELAMILKDRGDDTHYFKYGVYKQWFDQSEIMESYFKNVQLWSK